MNTKEIVCPNCKNQAIVKNQRLELEKHIFHFFVCSNCDHFVFMDESFNFIKSIPAFTFLTGKDVSSS